MTKLLCSSLFLSALSFLFTSCSDSEAKKEIPSNRISMHQTESGKWELRMNDESLVINGAGGQTQLALMKASGANTIRTWGAETLHEQVDGRNLVERAKDHDLMITAGYWVEHTRHGFDYGDPKQVQAQRERVKQFISEWKNEDTINIWGLGNEMEWHGNDLKVWKELEELAKLVKEEDPTRLIVTFIAGAPANKIQALIEHCPTIDILGVNSYAGGPTTAKAAAAAGWEKPVMIGEFGPWGHWEVEKTSWGAPIEQTNAQKEEHYLKTHRDFMEDPSGLGVGTYAFFWGQKQERTPTWYGMFLISGEKLPAVDAMTMAWTGKWPTNRCPKISRFSSSIEKSTVAAKQPVEVTLEITDPDGDPVSLTWTIAKEATDLKEGGDKEAAPPELPVTMTETATNTWQFESPEEPGNYRLFLVARDGNGAASAGNFPFQVE